MCIGSSWWIHNNNNHKSIRHRSRKIAGKNELNIQSNVCLKKLIKFIENILFKYFQVQRLDSIRLAFTELWAEEHLRMFFKGLSARLVQSAAFSFSIILGYETIKRISINDQYKHLVKW